MKKIAILLLCCFPALFAFANDGVFFATGNQLIPITETDISVKKEVLTINRVGDHLEVTVYYEFFNPKGEKELLVGFEAEAPYPPQEEYMKLFPLQPHMRNFKVVMNGQVLPFEVAHVERWEDDGTGIYKRPSYVKNGHIQSWTRKQCEDSLIAWDYNSCPFDFVYHFKAKFRPGLNIIQHTYDFDLSFSVEEEFFFPYILTAANRWANHQIDDFTLNINMGNRESFYILPEFYKDANEWNILGKGKVSMNNNWGMLEGITPLFHIQEGSLSFHKTNFSPDGELHILKRRFWSFSWAYWDDFGKDEADGLISDVKEQYNPLWVSNEYIDKSVLSADQKRILRNLPFAYRGYIFKTKSLQDFFESTEWYIPNPSYDGNMEALSEGEKKWVKFWK